MLKKFSAFVLGVFLGMAGLALAETPNGIHGAFNGNLQLPTPFQFLFGGPLTGIYLQHVAPFALALGPAGAHLGATVANKDEAGTCTLGTNCAITFINAYTTAPACQGTDQTSAAAVKAAPTTSGVTFTGTGTDVIAYFCIGNPN